MTRHRSQQAFKSLFFPADRPAPSLQRLSRDLDLVFGSRTLGFRELLATIVYGKYLDGGYNPRTGLYDCHPRSLYEQDMRPVLGSRGVPCGQSGPLNIAKATRALNAEWAAQRRPREDANALLRLVDAAMDMSDAGLQEFAKELGRRFDVNAHEVALSQNDFEPVDSSVRLATVVRELIERYPLGGASPQAVCGIALETEFRHTQGITVDGARDSASTTNRTSKKVGDVTVERGQDIQRIYEVTVKSFSEQRISEAAQSVRAFFDGEIPDDVVIQVLCRPQDVPSMAAKSSARGHIGEYAVDGLLFEFFDIFEWLAMKIAEFSLADRRHFFAEVQDFLNGTRVPTEVRKWWAAAFAP